MDARDGLVLGVHRDFVKRVKEKMPKDHGLLLVESSTCLELLRATYAAIGKSTEGMYTDVEYSSVVFEFLVKGATHTFLTQKYGLSR